MKGIARENMSWIETKLTGHLMTFSFDNFTSALFCINNGCDQRCPLSVILYLHYNAGLLEVAGTFKGELAPGFIDYLVYLAVGPDLEHAHSRIVDMMERPLGGYH